MTRPRVLITRPLPEPVLEAARAICDVVVSPDNEALNIDDSGLALLAYDAILTTLGDAFTAAAFASVPQPRCKLLANFGMQQRF